MKKKLIIVSVLIATILLIAAFTKPTDKEIKIKVIDVIWGNKAPDKIKAANYSSYYEKFMNLTTQVILIDDWVFVKRIRYIEGSDEKIIGFAAFGKIMINQ